MVAKSDEQEPNLPTVNDTEVQTDLPPATDDSQEQQEASDFLPYMVTLGGDVFSVKARNSTEAGKKAQKLYDEKHKETN